MPYLLCHPVTHFSKIHFLISFVFCGQLSYLRKSQGKIVILNICCQYLCRISFLINYLNILVRKIFGKYYIESHSQVGIHCSNVYGVRTSVIHDDVSFWYYIYLCILLIRIERKTILVDLLRLHTWSVMITYDFCTSTAIYFSPLL